MAKYFELIFLPLRFGFLALFDKRKLSIMDPKLIELLKCLKHPTEPSLDYFKDKELVKFVDERKLALDMMTQKTSISANKHYKASLLSELEDIL